MRDQTRSRCRLRWSKHCSFRRQERPDALEAPEYLAKRGVVSREQQLARLAIGRSEIGAEVAGREEGLALVEPKPGRRAMTVRKPLRAEAGRTQASNRHHLGCVV